MFGRRRSAPSAPRPVPFLESMSDGPTVRLNPPPEPAPARPRRPAFAVLLGVLALSGAVLAAVLGWRALDQAQTARALAGNAAALSPSAQPPPVTGPPGDGTVLVEPSGGPPPSGPAQAESPTPPPGYTNRELIIPLGCAATMFLDADEPHISVSESPAAEPTPRRACRGASSVLRLGPGANAGASFAMPVPAAPASSSPVSSLSASGPPASSRGGEPGQGGAGRTAQACEQQIRNTPLDPGTTVPIKPGAALCVRATTGRIVLLEVVAVDADRATIRANSWR